MLVVTTNICSWQCFSYLDGRLPPATDEDVVNLISYETIWRNPCVFPSRVLLEDCVCDGESFLLPKPCESIALVSSSCCTPSPTFALKSPVIMMMSLFGMPSRVPWSWL